MSIATQQIFKATPGLGPLDAACLWTAEHTRQGADRLLETPFLLFNEHMPPSAPGRDYWRRIVAVETSTFLDSMRGRTTPIYYNEIVPSMPGASSGAPAKLAYDCELKTDDLARAEAAFGTRDVAALYVACDALMPVLIAETLAALSPLVGRQLTAEHVVELDCSRPGKWSRHIIVDGSDATHESVAFASTADCGEFVRRLLVASPHAARLAVIVDKSIYANRHPLRTAYSAKRDSPTAFRPLGPPAPCDVDLLARSLRSCFRVRSPAGEFYHQPAGEWRLVSSAYLLHEPAAMRAPLIRLLSAVAVSLNRTARPTPRFLSGVSGGPLLSAVYATVITAPEFSTYRPRADRSRMREHKMLIVDCDGTACADAPNGAHRVGHRCIYLAIDLLARRFTQCCYSSTCGERRASRLPARSQPLSRETSDAIGAYLASSEWPLGELVGVDFCAAVGLDQ